MNVHQVLGREWQWLDSCGVSGVHTYEGQLVWWHTPGGPGGRFNEVATEQAFTDFARNGPSVAAPLDVVRELLALLGAGQPPWLKRLIDQKIAQPEVSPAPEAEIDAALRRALLGLSNGDWPSVEGHARMVLQHRPEDGEALFALGVALGAQGRLDAGEEYLLAAVQRCPNHYDAWYNLGVLHLERRQPEQAVPAFQRSLEIEPDNHPVLYQLGCALELVGQVPEALAAYRDAVRTSPNSGGYWHYSGMDFTHQAQVAIARLNGRTTQSFNRPPRSVVDTFPPALARRAKADVFDEDAVAGI